MIDEQRDPKRLGQFATAKKRLGRAPSIFEQRVLQERAAFEACRLQGPFRNDPLMRPTPRDGEN